MKWQRARCIAGWDVSREVWVKAEPPCMRTAYDGKAAFAYETNYVDEDGDVVYVQASKTELGRDFADDIELEPAPEWIAS